ncbi:MAG: hypothetical protein PHC95_12825 [Parabacteroides sp.]|nr:hypothetical protein [Parabacteroides sp.]
MPTTKQLYGREGVIEIHGIRFTPKIRHEAKCDGCSKGFTEEEFKTGAFEYSKAKRSSEIYLCPECFKKYYGGTG